ncbi:MAG TPA: hypothetical protein VEI73_06410 [Candidatus Acidoferrum sp.]|nr:hypothetical protein [Candidatus Acidoferrum sp.]
MTKILASIVTTLLIIAMTLGAMFILVRATVYVTSLESPIERAVAMGAELLLGVVLLLGTVWLATHLAVRIFGPKEPPPLPSFDIPSKVPSHGGSVV